MNASIRWFCAGMLMGVVCCVGGYQCWIQPRDEAKYSSRVLVLQSSVRAEANERVERVHKAYEDRMEAARQTFAEMRELQRTFDDLLYHVSAQQERNGGS